MDIGDETWYFWRAFFIDKQLLAVRSSLHTPILLLVDWPWCRLKGRYLFPSHPFTTWSQFCCSVAQVFNLKIPTIRKYCLFEGRGDAVSTVWRWFVAPWLGKIPYYWQMNSLTEANPLIPLALINPGFKHVPRLLRCIGVGRTPLELWKPRAPQVEVQDLWISLQPYPKKDPAGAGILMPTMDWGILMRSMAHHFSSSTVRIRHGYSSNVWHQLRLGIGNICNYLGCEKGHIISNDHIDSTIFPFHSCNWYKVVPQFVSQVGANNSNNFGLR